MRKLLAAVAAVSLATTAPALAGDSHHNGGGWSGGYHRHWNGYGYGYGWGAPLLGGLAGAAIIGSALATPYYGYGGYGYAPSYYYPTPPVPPQMVWCQGPYGLHLC